MKHTKRIILLFMAVMAATICSRAQESKKPQLYGLVKARYETALENGDMRFSVRNTRLGVKGFATSNMRYAMQMELNSLGNFSVLDSYAAFLLGNFELSLGQQPYKFSTELGRGAGGYFANRSFVAKYVSRYYGESNAQTIVSDIGARDIGAILQYAGKWRIPVTFNFGVLNGAGINEAAWNKYLNLLGRIDVGSDNGLRLSASYMGGKNAMEDRMDMWGVEAYYTRGPVAVEAEFAMRYLDKGSHTDVMTVGVVNAMYTFRMAEKSVIKGITPQLRWDIADNVKFINQQTGLDSFDAQRITAGVRFGLTEKILQSELRINYEHYFLKRKPSDYSGNHLLQDKFSIEFFARF